MDRTSAPRRWSKMVSPLGDGDYLDLRERSSNICQSYFELSAVQAPESITNLGLEVDQFVQTLDLLVAESKNPQSTILPSDNTFAAQRVLNLALRGVRATLEAVDKTLSGLRVDRNKTQNWWSHFTLVSHSNGSDITLANLKDRVAYHHWAIDLAVRSLTEGHSQDASASARLSAAAADISRLQELLRFQLSKTDSEGSIVRRFNEKPMFSTFPMELAVRTSMFWSFKAIKGLECTNSEADITAENYINLLKASWLLVVLRMSLELETLPAEVITLLKIISSQLLEAFEKFTTVEWALPDTDSIDAFGDFHILAEEVGWDGFVQQSPTSGAMRTHWRDSLLSISSAGSSTPDTSHPQSTQASEDAEHFGPPSSPPPAFPPPVAPKTPVFRKRKPLPISIKPARRSPGRTQAVADVTSLRQNPKLPTPPQSPAVAPASSRGSTASTYSILDSYSSPCVSPTQSVKEHMNEEISRPTVDAVIDELYGDSPTLGTTTLSGMSSSAEDLSPTTTSADTKAKGKQPIDSAETDYRNKVIMKALKTPKSPIHASRRLSAPPLERFSAHAEALERVRYERDTAESDCETGSRIWDLDFAVAYGLRPGERQLMPDEIASMKMLCRNDLNHEKPWQECTIRIFQNQISGDFRLLTLRGNDVDQKLIPLKNAELVPEYAYHENFPVIFLRRAGPGTYSLQSGPGEKKKKSRLPLQPIPNASLYYRFRNLVDMFVFQLAMLGESVEADCTVRTVKYTRGFRHGEHINHKARVQLWKEVPSQYSGLRRPSLNQRTSSTTATVRSAPTASLVKVDSTRLVVYLNEIIITLFVTDDITMSPANNRTLRIKPSSHRKFGNPSAVKACVLGNHDISGGFRLDKEGGLVEDLFRFDDFKWFEIDFASIEDAGAFQEDFDAALQERRRQRVVVEGLKRQAAQGIRAGETVLPVQR